MHIRPRIAARQSLHQVTSGAGRLRTRWPCFIFSPFCSPQIATRQSAVLQRALNWPPKTKRLSGIGHIPGLDASSLTMHFDSSRHTHTKEGGALTSEGPGDVTANNVGFLMGNAPCIH